MISSLANYRSFFSFFLSYPPLGIFLARQLIKYASRENDVWSRGNVYLVKIGTKLGQNLSEMEVRTFARIRKVIWDQLLASKAEIIKGMLHFSFACENPKRHVFE